MTLRQSFSHRSVKGTAHHADTSMGSLYEHLEPTQAIDVEVAPQMRLLGYTLTPEELRAGESPTQCHVEHATAVAFD